MSAYFGLDFGSSNLRIAQVDLMGTKAWQLKVLGSVPNAAGSLDFTDKTVVNKIQSSLRKLIGETKLKENRVVVSIPEAQVFSRVVTMPAMTDAELSSAIQWEAEQFIPIPVADVEIDYSVVKPAIKGSSDSMKVYLVAAPKNQLQAMVELLLSVGLDPIAVESEMVAIARSLTFVPNPAPSMIVSIGALSTILGIVQDGALLFSYVLNMGGVALSRSLSQGLALPLPQAEEYKKTYGLSKDQLEGKVRAALAIPINQLLSEIRKAMEFYAKEYKTNIAKILLSGGGAFLPDLSTYITESISGVEILMADPFAACRMNAKQVIPKDRAAYAAAIGLAMRVF